MIGGKMYLFMQINQCNEASSSLEHWVWQKKQNWRKISIVLHILYLIISPYTIFSYLFKEYLLISYHALMEWATQI